MDLHQPLYLIHTTSLRTLKKVITEGSLVRNLDFISNKIPVYRWDKKLKKEVPYQYGEVPDDQFPGVYFRLAFENWEGTTVDLGENEVALIFCLKLLQRGDFHFNQDMDTSFGYIRSDTIGATSFLRQMKIGGFGQKATNYQNEIVVHHPVPLSFLREIWVENETAATQVKEILHRNNFKTAQLPSDFLQVRTTYHKKPLKCPSTKIQLYAPTYCFYSFDFDQSSQDTPEHLYRLGINCGMTQEEAHLASQLEDTEFNEKIRPFVERTFYRGQNRYEPPW